MVIECADAAACQVIAEAQRELVMVGIEVMVFVVLFGYILWFAITPDKD